MALFGQDRPDPNAVQIGAVLGDLLTGGSKARTQGAYVDQYKKNADAADAMWGARDSRARAIAREGLTGDAMRALMTGGDGQFGTMAQIISAGATPDLRNLGNFQIPDYARRVIDREGAFLQGDTELANMLGAVNSGKDYKPVEVNAQGIAYDPNLPLGSVTFKTTPVADSAIAENNAQGAAATSRAATYAGRVSFQNRNDSIKTLGDIAVDQSSVAENLSQTRKNQADAIIKEVNADRARNGEPLLTSTEASEIEAQIKKDGNFTVPVSGKNPVKSGVQPNTDNGVGAPTPLGTTTPGRSVNARSVTDFLAPSTAPAYRGPLMATSDPVPGEIRKGYRFKGGNWRDKKNWTKVE